LDVERAHKSQMMRTSQALSAGKGRWYKYGQPSTGLIRE